MEQEVDTFWDKCDLVQRDPEIIHGAPAVKGSRLNADDLIGSVEAYQELSGMTIDQAIRATASDFPTTPGGEKTLRALLAYQEAHFHQLAL